MPETATVDTSGSLAQAVGGGIVKELPGALAESRQNRAGLKTATDEYVSTVRTAAKERDALGPPPQAPKPQPAPEMQNRPPQEAWGSVAMGLAMLGSAFTRQPLTHALNAAAGVMNAYHKADADAYKTAVQHWKDTSDYALKMADYQRDAYKDAIEMIEKAPKDALAILRAKAAVFGDDPLGDLAKAGNIVGTTTLLSERAARDEQLRRENVRGHQLADATAELLDARKVLAAAPPGSPEAAEAQARIATAQQRYRDIDKPAGTTQEQQFGSETDILERKRAEYRADPANGGKDPDAATIEKWRAELKADTTKHTEHNIIAYKDGKKVFEGNARAVGGGWVNSATNEKIDADRVQDVGRTGLGTAGGGRGGAQTSRQLAAGREILSDLQSAVRLPVGTTTGVFGFYRPGSGIMDAPKAILAERLTTDDEDYLRSALASLERELGIVVSPVYGGKWTADSFTPLMPRKGQTVHLMLFNLARMKQVADNALESVIHTDWVGAEQKGYAQTIRDSLTKAMPWTTGDVLDWREAKGKKKQTFRQFVEEQGIGKTGQTPAADAGSPGPAAALPPAAVKDLKEHDTPERRKQFDEIFGAGAAERALR